ncbi:MAG: hypothetical protein AAGA57_13095, partial [Planctomycetota bacterium]
MTERTTAPPPRMAWMAWALSAVAWQPMPVKTARRSSERSEAVIWSAATTPAAMALRAMASALVPAPRKEGESGPGERVRGPGRLGVYAWRLRG